jgi:Fe2+ or Zn2+ uptake regulation protein
MKRDMVVTLHNAGYRFTSQRQKVLDILKDSHDHPTAEDIYKRSQNHGEKVSIGTIYRTLELMEKLGLVRKFNIGDRNRYELLGSNSNPDHYCHLVCEKCGKIIDISDDILSDQVGTLDEIVEEIGYLSDFRVAGHQFRIYGFCHDCR